MNRMPTKSNFYVFTGGSSSGKSSLVDALAARGCTCVSEAGRLVVHEENASGGDGQPWINLERFAELIFEKSRLAFETLDETKAPVFFDRSFLEALSCLRSLSLPIPQRYADVVASHRFNRMVFVTPPWEEIFTNDAERKTTFEAAVKDYEGNLSTYMSAGYEPLEVPRMSVEERVKFVLDRVAGAGSV